MQPGSVERRRSARSKGTEHVRIRPADPRHPEKICIPANLSKTGLFFMTATGNYFTGMNVFVTRDFSPENPRQREESGVVVRVRSLGSGHAGVAILMKPSLPKRVLFVCIGNSCRSPMAEALARHLAPDAIAPSSAGLSPLGYISRPTQTALAEIGISSTGQQSKPLQDNDVASADLLINMAGRSIENLVRPPTRVEQWKVTDPFGCDLAVYRSVRDEIGRRVTELAWRLRGSAA